MHSLTFHSGHYDILYKAADVPQQPIPTQPPLQVQLASNFDDFVPQATASHFGDVMNMIPGMPSAGFGQKWASLSYDFSPSPTSQPQITPVQPYPSVATPATSVSSSHLDFMMPSHSNHASQYTPTSHHGLHLDQPSMTLPIHSAPPPPVSLERTTSLTVERGGPFRPSMYELEPGFGSVMQAQPFQTSIFRKWVRTLAHEYSSLTPASSHFNTAHFLNPDFQPEEWSPDGEYTTGNKGRHKSHSS